MIPFRWTLTSAGQDQLGIIHGVDLRHAAALLAYAPEYRDLCGRHGINGDVLAQVTTDKNATETSIEGGDFRLHLLRKGATAGAHPVVVVTAH